MPKRADEVILPAMRILAYASCLIALLPFACGGPSAPLPSARARGGGGGVGIAESGTGNLPSYGAASARGGAATGGITSTYVEPGCPNTPKPQFDAECDALDQSSCPPGEGCYPTISVPTAACEPEVYRTLCLPSGQGQQWDDCYALTDCAPGFICVVGGIGTQCQRACNAAEPISCPKGLFCDAIDLPGIGTCY